MVSGQSAPRVVAVGGGKGGVGKSVVACNLAIAFAERGLSVVLVDADLGCANQHTLLGIDRPSPGIQALLEKTALHLDDTAIATRVPNLRLVAGAGAIPNVANINHGQKQKLLRHVHGLAADVVVIDVGAGTSHNVVDFFEGAHVRVVVVTPQLTAIQNAYAFLKAAVLRHLRHLADEATQARRFEELLTSRETERVDEVLTRLEAVDPAFAATLRNGLAGFDARLLGNQVSQSQELGIFHGVTRMVRDFLGVSAPLIGHIGTSRGIHDSINRRDPLLLASPRDPNSTAFRAIATDLLGPARATAASRVRRPTLSPEIASEDPERILRKGSRVATFGWKARLERAGVEAPALVVDVGPGGLGIQTRTPLKPGERWTLRIEEADITATLPVLVRNFDADSHRAGLAFVVTAEETERDGREQRELITKVLDAASASLSRQAS